MGAAPLDAGELAPWLERTRAVLAGEGDAEVPCGDCTACCSSAQFVAIEADEVDTLARVPSRVTVPAPGRPGTVLLGYDAEGRCPMLGPTGCTIYEVRPRACRMFDCRVFAAAGLAPERPEAAAFGFARRVTVRAASANGTTEDLWMRFCIRSLIGVSGVLVVLGAME